MVFLLYFRTTIIENNCTDIKKTVNFYVTTVVNKESFLCVLYVEPMLKFSSEPAERGLCWLLLVLIILSVLETDSADSLYI